jgi:hypothetical protein
LNKLACLFFSMKEVFIKASEAIHRVDIKPKRATSGLCLTWGTQPKKEKKSDTIQWLSIRKLDRHHVPGRKKSLITCVNCCDTATTVSTNPASAK